MTLKEIARRAWANVLRPFTKVHPDEVVLVSLMGLTAFLLLAAYYLLKTVREPLILLQGGAEVKLYARAGQALLMVVVVHFYGELARRVGRGRLLTFVFLFFVSNLVVFTILAGAGVSIGLPFFLWVGVFSYTVVAQFWALAADIYDRDQGKRLFPLIGAGSSVGAVVGGIVARLLVPFGPAVLMGAAVVVLLACVALIFGIDRLAPTKTVHPEIVAHAPLASEGAWKLLARDKYLWLIAGMVILLNWVNSSGEYVLDRTLLAAAKAAAAHGATSQAFIGAFKADYYVWYNSLGVGLQLLLVSRVLAFMGVRGALYWLPAFALIGYGSAFLLPTLAVVRLVKIGENSLQYSLQDTTRHALFLVTSRAEKFVGKTAVDTIAVRLGAIMSALAVFTGARLGWSTAVFVGLNVVLATGWIGFVALIGIEHRRREGGLDGKAAARAPGPGRAAVAAAAGTIGGAS
jgi:AAA family ATP:ADP antiporter